MPHYVLTAVGPDQPGILAALTDPLMRLRCNLEDTSATILRGHFSMMMVVRSPEEVDAEMILREIEAACVKLDLRVDARPLPGAAGLGPQASHVLSVYGADKPGIMHRTSQLLAAHGVNMLELDTRVVGRAAHPVYAMLLEVAVPEGVGEAALRRDLDQLGRDLGVDVSMRPIEER